MSELTPLETELLKWCNAALNEVARIPQDDENEIYISAAKRYLRRAINRARGEQG